MPKKSKTGMNVERLWQIERLGAPSLAPDGAQAVAPLTSFSMDDNSATSALWLLSTLGGAPRRLTSAGEKDGQPLWSPRGDLIAFMARREQEGKKDTVPQLYVIAPDGGEAARAATVDTGIEGFRWFPDGRRLAFVSWVWPELKGSKAQSRRAKEWAERKETAYATSESIYRHWDHHLPQGRVPHLHLLELGGDGKPAKVRDLFEGSAWELERAEPGADSFDVSPDGRRIVFACDPSTEKRQDARFALAELDLRSGRIELIAQDVGWHMAAPRYSHDGERVAFLASHQAVKHTMPRQLAIWERVSGEWGAISAEWDHEVQAPLRWEEGDDALLFTAQQKGRTHLWRFDIADRRAECLVEGGTVLGFDKAAGTLVTLADAIDHPARLHAHLPGEPARRIESFNDALLAGTALGRSEERWIQGAASREGGPREPVQVWLTYPPGFDPNNASKNDRKKGHATRWPLLHVIHGGPHTAAGDGWHYRWNVHAFAAQGYVVACVNYHGSSSFGYAFLDSITHRWGALELQDIEAVTDALLQESWADPARVFASGGSYGGFMVAWMNGQIAAGRYAAYVCHAGCYDWQAMFADDAWAWQARELGAWYWDKPAQIASQNPASFAANMHTPTLVCHGALDYRVPDQQGLAYYNTLKARGVDARLVWFPDENHWVLKPRNSRLWYGEFFDWLERHDPARGAGKRHDPARRAGKRRAAAAGSQ